MYSMNLAARQVTLVLGISWPVISFILALGLSYSIELTCHYDEHCCGLQLSPRPILFDTVEQAEWIKPVSEWLGSLLLPIQYSLHAIHKRKWDMFDHHVCVCARARTILTFEPGDFYETLYEHYAISAYSNTMCFQDPTVWNKNKAEIQTCEVRSRLYELWMGKAQPRRFANHIQANLKQTFVITLKENPTLSVVPLPVYKVNKKCWKQIFCMCMLVVNITFL
jgi:hypothetical protein